eukprot:g41233.t1
MALQPVCRTSSENKHGRLKTNSSAKKKKKKKHGATRKALRPKQVGNLFILQKSGADTRKSATVQARNEVKKKDSLKTKHEEVAGWVWTQSFPIEPLASQPKLRTWPATSRLPTNFMCICRRRGLPFDKRRRTGSI